MSIWTDWHKELEKQLEDFGIELEEAKTEAKLIIEKTTHLTANQQIVSDLSLLKPEWLTSAQEILKKRKKRIPIQYILEETTFCGFDLKVVPGVLIPRPDTETLVATFLALAKEPQKIAEIGVGSGAIAISLLKKLPDCQVFACDISPVAIKTTLENARLHKVNDRLKLVQGDWQKVLPNDFDAIVSNPPYLSSKEKETLPSEIKENEPFEALFDLDGDGLSFYRQFAKQLLNHLASNSNSFIALEIGTSQAKLTTEIFTTNGWQNVKVHNDIHNLSRVLTARKN